MLKAFDKNTVTLIISNYSNNKRTVHVFYEDKEIIGFSKINFLAKSTYPYVTLETEFSYIDIIHEPYNINNNDIVVICDKMLISSQTVICIDNAIVGTISSFGFNIDVNNNFNLFIKKHDSIFCIQSQRFMKKEEYNSWIKRVANILAF